MEWRNVYRGFIMGVSDLVPGVSGGTIAVLLGIYDRLIAGISGIFTKEWKVHFRFLFPLALGVATALFALSRVMRWLLAHHEAATKYFFIGLIIGILPFLFRESDAKNTFRWYHILLLIVSIVLIAQLPTNVEGTLIANRSLSTYAYLFLSGVLASAAMILPGVSGSLVFLILGTYDTVLQAIEDIEIGIILVVGTGIFIGIITMSKLIHFFLARFRIATFSIIIGLVIGSVYVIFPGWASNFLEVIVFVIVFVAGLLIATLLGKVEY